MSSDFNWLSDQTLHHLRDLTEEPDFANTKYRIQNVLGRGGMATVYVAYDQELDREVALKVLDHHDTNGDLATRMLSEARIVARLEHPGIVPIHDVGHLPDGRIYYAMKYVRGQTLDELSGKPIQERLRLFQNICEAVAFAHEKGVIHRDLKPENIMVGNFGEVLVMDWGLAKVLHEAAKTAPASQCPTANQPITDHGVVMGTPGYMAPEQSSGEIEKINEQTDVYALGAILYFLLPKKIPRPLQAIYRRAMAPRQGDRYQSAIELRDDIVSYLDGARVTAYRENLIEKAQRWVSRNYFFVLLILTYLVMRVLLLVLAER
jgi:eukaryotic-like serine/threonine-protein kinase